MKVADHWQQLMLKMEDRLKLVNASVAFYKTSEQVLFKRLYNLHKDLQVTFKSAVGCAAFTLDVNVRQVCSVLESLEQEYKREEDWCGGADKLGPNSESDHVTPMISKHLEQKEAFLKVISVVPPGFQFYPKKNAITEMCSHSSLTQACTLARRNADVFLKYLHRNSVNMPGMLSHVKAPETQVKSKWTTALTPASFCIL